MKKILFIFLFISILFTAMPSLAANIKGTVASFQSAADIDTSNMTNLERKKFEDSIVVSSNNGLLNAVVSIESINSSAYSNIKISKVARLDQINNSFSPRVVPIMVGGEITVVNSDKIFHNVHAYHNGENLFIANLAKYKQESRHIIDKEGIVSMKCEVHLSMQGYAIVLNNPFFAVTDKNGNYTIENVPPGKYNLIVWHELLGKKENKIVVKDNNSPVTSNFKFDHITTVSPRWY